MALVVKEDALPGRHQQALPASPFYNQDDTLRKAKVFRPSTGFVMEPVKEGTYLFDSIAKRRHDEELFKAGSGGGSHSNNSTPRGSAKGGKRPLLKAGKKGARKVNLANSSGIKIVSSTTCLEDYCQPEKVRAEIPKPKVIEPLVSAADPVQEPALSRECKESIERIKIEITEMRDDMAYRDKSFVILKAWMEKQQKWNAAALYQQVDTLIAESVEIPWSKGWLSIKPLLKKICQLLSTSLGMGWSVYIMRIIDAPQKAFSLAAPVRLTPLSREKMDSRPASEKAIEEMTTQELMMLDMEDKILEYFVTCNTDTMTKLHPPLEGMVVPSGTGLVMERCFEEHGEVIVYNIHANQGEAAKGMHFPLESFKRPAEVAKSFLKKKEDAEETAVSQNRLGGKNTNAKMANNFFSRGSQGTSIQLLRTSLPATSSTSSDDGLTFVSSMYLDLGLSFPLMEHSKGTLPQSGNASFFHPLGFGSAYARHSIRIKRSKALMASLEVAEGCPLPDSQLGVLPAVGNVSSVLSPEKPKEDEGFRPLRNSVFYASREIENRHLALHGHSSVEYFGDEEQAAAAYAEKMLTEEFYFPSEHIAEEEKLLENAEISNSSLAIRKIARRDQKEVPLMWTEPSERIAYNNVIDKMTGIKRELKFCVHKYAFLRHEHTEFQERLAKHMRTREQELKIALDESLDAQFELQMLRGSRKDIKDRLHLTDLCTAETRMRDKAFNKQALQEYNELITTQSKLQKQVNRPDVKNFLAEMEGYIKPPGRLLEMWLCIFLLVDQRSIHNTIPICDWVSRIINRIETPSERQEVWNQVKRNICCGESEARDKETKPVLTYMKDAPMENNPATKYDVKRAYRLCGNLMQNMVKRDAVIKVQKVGERVQAIIKKMEEAEEAARRIPLVDQ
eukprot:gene23418-28350_t